jgi:hypothetical protein
MEGGKGGAILCDKPGMIRGRSGWEKTTDEGERGGNDWIPAFAGMTKESGNDKRERE